MRAALIAVALLAQGALASNSINDPELKETQQGLITQRELFDNDADIRAAVKACYPDAEALLGLLLISPVLSYAKNVYVVTDVLPTGWSAASRSAAVLSMNCFHHMARGIYQDREIVPEAAVAFGLMTKIMEARPRDWGDAWHRKLEWALLSLSCYLWYEVSERRDKLASALRSIARCAFAKDNAEKRGNRTSGNQSDLKRFLDERSAVSKGIHEAFRRHTAGGAEGKVLIYAEYGARELPPDHPRYEVELVPCVAATVASATATQFTTERYGRFAELPVHAFFLLVLTLHLGLALPLDAQQLETCRWWWGRNNSFGLVFHLFGKHRDHECDDDHYAMWNGCSMLYIFLPDALYAKLHSRLLPPHYSLNLRDKDVVELILEAYNTGEVVGDMEFLPALFEGPDHYHCAKTWAGPDVAAAAGGDAMDEG